MKRVEIFTDGACSPNPGPGGWGCILRYNGVEKELRGGQPEATNNSMEMMAAIAALSALKEPCVVDLYTDSKYLRNGMTQWVHGWVKKGWRTQTGPVKNKRLWQILLELSERHQVSWHWVRGHDGHVENERCDELARLGRSEHGMRKKERAA